MKKNSKTPKKPSKTLSIAKVQDGVDIELDSSRKLANILSMTDSNLVDTAKDFTRVVNTPVLLAGEDTVMAYYEYLRDKKNNFSAGTIRVKAYRLQKIYDIAMQFGVIQSNPVAKLKILKLIELPKRKTQQIALNINSAKRKLFLESDKVPKRTKAILEFLTLTALRVSEFVNLRLSHCKDYVINRDGVLEKYVEIKIFATKTNNEASVFIDRAKFYRLKPILRIVKRKEKNDYLLTNIHGKQMTRQGVDGLIRSAWALLFQEVMGAHQLRHFFATFQLESGVDIYKVSKMMRHQSIRTTSDVYAHARVNPEDFDIKGSEKDEIFDEDMEIDKSGIKPVVQDGVEEDEDFSEIFSDIPDRTKVSVKHKK